MKIFLTGGSGQVGHELQRSLSLHGQILAPTRQELNLADGDAVHRWLKEYRPDCLVNAAAYTAVDKAEENSALAFSLNAQLPAVLAAYAANEGIRLFHYSSDYVYDGSGKAPRREEGPTGPCNVYGKSKLAGDEAVVTSGASYVIFRTSWVYAARGSNFLRTILRLAGQREQLSVVDDQVGAPTTARLLADVTSLALNASLTSGIYHAACRGETSWHGFACEILRQAAALGWNLRATPDTVAPIDTVSYGAPAPRPLNSRLSVERLENALNIRLPHWRTALQLTLQDMAAGAEQHISREKA